MHFTCPNCFAPIDGESCASCHAFWPIERGIQDFAPEIVRPTGLAQRTMQSRAVVRVYERAFRPALTRLVSDLRYADEEHFLATHVIRGPALDVACGTGRYTRSLAGHLGDDQVAGLDLSRPMLRTARRIAPRLQFVRGSAQRLPLANDALGTIACFGALHLFPDPRRALAEAGRTLFPGGRLLGLTAIESGRWRRLERAVGQLITLHFLREDELRQGCADAGLEIVAWQPRGGMLLFAAEAS